MVIRLGERLTTPPGTEGRSEAQPKGRIIVATSKPETRVSIEAEATGESTVPVADSGESAPTEAPPAVEAMPTTEVSVPESMPTAEASVPESRATAEASVPESRSVADAASEAAATSAHSLRGVARRLGSSSRRRRVGL